MPSPERHTPPAMLLCGGRYISQYTMQLVRHIHPWSTITAVPESRRLRSVARSETHAVAAAGCFVLGGWWAEDHNAKKGLTTAPNRDCVPHVPIQPECDSALLCLSPFPITVKALQSSPPASACADGPCQDRKSVV